MPVTAEHPTRVTVDAAADALVLTALTLRAGLGPVEALEAVAAEVPVAVGHQLRVVASAQRWGQDAATAWTHVGDAWRPAALAWQAAERSGAAPAGVVLAAADRMRRQEVSRVEAAVQRAGVLLVLPLGLCFLPGFAATTVLPVVLHLTRSAPRSQLTIGNHPDGQWLTTRCSRGTRPPWSLRMINRHKGFRCAAAGYVQTRQQGAGCSWSLNLTAPRPGPLDTAGRTRLADEGEPHAHQEDRHPWGGCHRSGR